MQLGNRIYWPNIDLKQAFKVYFSQRQFGHGRLRS